MTYIRPLGNISISDDYREHQARGSVEPGVDYESGRGANVVASTSGRVVFMDNGTGGMDGRRIMLAFDDGNYMSIIHLNYSNQIAAGQRFNQGQHIAESGQSRRGMDRDPSMGAHAHVTFWEQPGRTPVPGSTKPQDFEAFLARQASGGGGSAEGATTRLKGKAWVEEVQRKFIRIGHLLGPSGVDGVDGPRFVEIAKWEQGIAGLKQDGIVGDATNAYLDKVLTPAPVNPGTPSGRTLFGWNWNGIAAMLRSQGRYSGNNTPGPVMVMAFQDWLNDSGYNAGTPDGDPGVSTVKAAQRWLNKTGRNAGAVDGDPGGSGSNTYNAWHKAEAENWIAFPNHRG